MATSEPVSPTEQTTRRSMRGSSQTGVRLYNERLVLSLIRAHGQLPKAEIARLTGLSPQTVSVIVRQLEVDNLLVKGEALKGKVGQPLQPFLLNPDGAFSIGLKVGRRSGDLVLLGLDGVTRKAVHHPYHFPSPDEFMAFARSGLAELTADLSPELRKRICGLGIAMPFEIWKWEEETGAPHDVMEAWRRFDLTSEMASHCAWPVFAGNDATAACAAELLLGRGRHFRDFAYFYIGYFVGGGIVQNGMLHMGPTGNAGALGSIPVHGTSGEPEQLIRYASFYLLERELRKAGMDASLLWRMDTDWHEADAAVKNWIDTAGRAIAQAAAAIASVIDPAAIIIDGAMPPRVRAQLVAAVRSRMAKINTDGISPFAIAEGSIGIHARAMGAASLPLFANFMVDRDVLFKED